MPPKAGGALAAGYISKFVFLAFHSSKQTLFCSYEIVNFTGYHHEMAH
jgi:hypothetical protein